MPAATRLKNRHFCITGKLILPRKVVHELILQRGGWAATSIRSSNSFLVVGEKPGKAKLQAALKHGCEQLTETQLWNLFIPSTLPPLIFAWKYYKIGDTVARQLGAKMTRRETAMSIDFMTEPLRQWYLSEMGGGAPDSVKTAVTDVLEEKAGAKEVVSKTAMEDFIAVCTELGLKLKLYDDEVVNVAYVQYLGAWVSGTGTTVGRHLVAKAFKHAKRKTGSTTGKAAVRKEEPEKSAPPPRGGRLINL